MAVSTDEEYCPECSEEMQPTRLLTGGRVGFFCEFCDIFVPEGAWIQIEHVR